MGVPTANDMQSSDGRESSHFQFGIRFRAYFDEFGSNLNMHSAQQKYGIICHVTIYADISSLFYYI